MNFCKELSVADDDAKRGEHPYYSATNKKQNKGELKLLKDIKNIKRK